VSQEIPVLETKRLSKWYGHVEALRGVDLCIYPGEVVALVGDNGAGKSTFVKTVAGVHPADEGELFLNGERVRFRSPLDARRSGIETVYQDLALANDLTVWGNLFLGREIRVKGLARWLGWMDKRAMRERAREELSRLRITIDSVDARIEDLSGGQRQAVAVARSMTWGRKLVMMDEPTANLGVEQGEKVARLVRTLADHRIAVLLISHNLSQVFALADRMVVLRHGRVVAERPTRATSKEQVVGWITGALAEDGEGRVNPPSPVYDRVPVDAARHALTTGASDEP
jgi:simple sugar transport system ATP-binding protein